MTGTTVDRSHYRGLDEILGAIAHWVSNYRKARAAQAELAKCGTDEVARIAHDLGVSSEELYNLAGKSADSADLLQKMLVALGVDPKALAHDDPTVMHDLQRLCVMCGHKQQCAHEFDVGTAAENYRKFCPNAYTLDALFKMH